MAVGGFRKFEDTRTLTIHDEFKPCKLKTALEKARSKDIYYGYQSKVGKTQRATAFLEICYATYSIIDKQNDNFRSLARSVRRYAPRNIERLSVALMSENNMDISEVFLTIARLREMMKESDQRSRSLIGLRKICDEMIGHMGSMILESKLNFTRFINGANISSICSSFASSFCPVQFHTIGDINNEIDLGCDLKVALPNTTVYLHAEFEADADLVYRYPWCKELVIIMARQPTRSYHPNVNPEGWLNEMIDSLDIQICELFPTDLMITEQPEMKVTIVTTKHLIKRYEAITTRLSIKYPNSQAEEDQADQPELEYIFEVRALETGRSCPCCGRPEIPEGLDDGQD